jgi:D-sedoheptulose 7-phosphate isomerase
MDQGTEFQNQVRTAITASIAAKQQLLADGQIVSTLARVSQILVDALRNGNKLMVFGNGGSAADAQHIAAEFVGRFAFNRPALPALALSVNSSCVTAIGNDYGFDLVFARQVEALARRGDVAVGISTSGNSPNVIRGLEAAGRMGVHTVGFAGAGGGKLKETADFCLCAPSAETPRIQECHILMGHILSEIAEREIFKPS